MHIWQNIKKKKAYEIEHLLIFGSHVQYPIYAKRNINSQKTNKVINYKAKNKRRRKKESKEPSQPITRSTRKFS